MVDVDVGLWTSLDSPYSKTLKQCFFGPVLISCDTGRTLVPFAARPDPNKMIGGRAHHTNIA